jgi:hypothetical protein
MSINQVSVILYKCKRACVFSRLRRSNPRVTPVTFHVEQHLASHALPMGFIPTTRTAMYSAGPTQRLTLGGLDMQVRKQAGLSKSLPFCCQ